MADETSEDKFLKRRRKIPKLMRWLIFFVTVATWLTIHEGAHIIAGILQGEEVRGIEFVVGFNVLPGFKVLFSTPESGRYGVKWGLIGVSGIAFTLTMGYTFYLFRKRLLHIKNRYLRYHLNYVLMLLLIADPLYYCVFFFLGTGDIHGVSLSFGVPKVLVFVVALLFLVMNTYLSERMGWKLISRFKKLSSITKG